jgi:hypothetical protein
MAQGRAVSGALGQIDDLEQSLETRPLTVAGSAMVAAIMQCAAWAVMRREGWRRERVTERTLSSAPTGTLGTTRSRATSDEQTDHLSVHSLIAGARCPRPPA